MEEGMKDDIETDKMTSWFSGVFPAYVVPALLTNLNPEQVKTVQHSLMPNTPLLQNDSDVFVVNRAQHEPSLEQNIALLLEQPEHQQENQLMSSHSTLLPLVVGGPGPAVQGNRPSCPRIPGVHRSPSLTTESPLARFSTLPALFLQTSMRTHQEEEDSQGNQALSSPALNVDHLPPPPFLRQGVLREDGAIYSGQDSLVPSPSPSPPPSPLTPCSLSPSPVELHLDPLSLEATVNVEAKDTIADGHSQEGLKKRGFEAGQEAGDRLRRSKRQRKEAQIEEKMHKDRTDPRVMPTNRSKRKPQAKAKVGGKGQQGTSVPDIAEEVYGGHGDGHADVDLTIPISRCIGEMQVVHVSSFDDGPFNISQVEPFRLSCQ